MQHISSTLDNLNDLFKLTAWPRSRGLTIVDRVDKTDRIDKVDRLDLVDRVDNSRQVRLGREGLKW